MLVRHREGIFARPRKQKNIDFFVVNIDIIRQNDVTTLRDKRGHVNRGQEVWINKHNIIEFGS